MYYNSVYVFGKQSLQNWPRHAKTCSGIAKCADSDHTAHAQCIIRAFALHSYILYQMIRLVDSEGPDQTARMRSLIWAFALHICPKTCLGLALPKCLNVAKKKVLMYGKFIATSQ